MGDLSTWIADPDMITAAIHVLAWIAGIVGIVLSSLFTGLIATLMYIWKQFRVQVDSLGVKVDRIANGLEHLTLETKTQITEIKTRCDGNHTNQRRRIEDSERI
jgi:hypothetical protein